MEPSGVADFPPHIVEGRFKYFGRNVCLHRSCGSILVYAMVAKQSVGLGKLAYACSESLHFRGAGGETEATIFLSFAAPFVVRSTNQKKGK